MHDALSLEYGEEWILDDCTLPLLEDHRDAFGKVIYRLNPILDSRNEDLTAQAVVAAASLGDWVQLLGGGDARSSVYNYTKTLWEPALINAFPNNPNGLKRKEIHGLFNNLRSFRNRVVHHEPIFYRNLKYVMGDIVEATSLINKEAAEIIKMGNSLDSVIDSKKKVLEQGDCCM